MYHLKKKEHISSHINEIQEIMQDIESFELNNT